MSDTGGERRLNSPTVSTLIRGLIGMIPFFGISLWRMWREAVEGVSWVVRGIGRVVDMVRGTWDLVTDRSARDMKQALASMSREQAGRASSPGDDLVAKAAERIQLYERWRAELRDAAQKSRADVIDCLWRSVGDIASLGSPRELRATASHVESVGARWP